MKKIILNISTIFIIAMSFIACDDNSNNGEAHKMHWDRDMCERCKMVVSVRNHAVQVINPKDEEVYKFDDIGCTIMWFKENDITWKNEAKILITDVNTGKWIDVRTAYFDTSHKTPMGYGFSANKTKEAINDENSEIINFEEVEKRILKRNR
ncbi:hypothetical protein CP965_02740 [Halarcobacter mediterraneus]|uniref:Protein NosL n=1 Tax=Halarcobacter mediterraneus TaxID=2023153 RepID=A0A4Q1B064_9BACT|nr:nitrous oxide reductase accessory protein NosL [Halarcobacter mediterraneus]RXK14382.1 hypothetical protein CP965_02740 [Halarcobacter mediterraneus]